MGVAADDDAARLLYAVATSVVLSCVGGALLLASTKRVARWQVVTELSIFVISSAAAVVAFGFAMR